MEKVKALLQSIEEETDASQKEKRVQDLLNERCDGSRNIIHICVAMCAPQSNKENDSGKCGVICQKNNSWKYESASIHVNGRTLIAHLWLISIARLGFGFGLTHRFLNYAGFFHWFRFGL